MGKRIIFPNVKKDPCTVMIWVCGCGTEFKTIDEWFKHSKEVKNKTCDDVLLEGKRKGLDNSLFV